MLRHALFVPLVLLPAAAEADISDAANACIDVLREQVGDVGGEVLENLWSEAGTLVRLRAADGAVYECVVWTGPEVADFRRVDGTEADGDTPAAASPIVSGEERVRFSAGTSGAALSGTLNPGTSVRYLLGASERQVLNVDVGSRGGAIDYRIFNPDGTLLLELISSDKPYQGELWQSGDHAVEVVNAGADPVSFDIGIGIE